jgi:amino acid transporter
MYGIVFILLGNLSGNAIAFGEYVMVAANHPSASRADVIGLAIAALSVAILLHVCSRRGGIIINNLFTIVKVSILIAIIVMGFIKASGHKLGGADKSTDNFDPKKSFHNNQRDIGSYSDSFLYIIYAYSGFEQPFYVLSEVSRPRKVFPKYTLIAMAIATTLFVLVNIAYLCAVPKDIQLDSTQDMATLFFAQMFGHKGAQRVMAALIAFSIFGNIVVMTFTASRVKQEIAKEGVLPFSLFFATGHTTPWAWLKAKWHAGRNPNVTYSQDVDDHLEQTPMAVLGLHWLSSVLLIAFTSMLDPTTSYSVLVSLYSYVVIVLNGFVVSGGLIYLHLNKSRSWSSQASFKPWVKPLHAIIYFVVCGFLLFAAFAKPSDGTPYSYSVSHIQWFIVPAIGLSTLAWGSIWYLGLKLVMLQKRKQLVVTRFPFIVQDEEDPGQWVQKSELVDHEWHTRVPTLKPSLDGHEMT